MDVFLYRVDTSAKTRVKKIGQTMRSCLPNRAPDEIRTHIDGTGNHNSIH